MDLAVLLALYILPLLCAVGRGLPGESVALIAAGLALLPGIGWLVGMYFALADRP